MGMKKIQLFQLNKTCKIIFYSMDKKYRHLTFMTIISYILPFSLYSLLQKVTIIKMQARAFSCFLKSMFSFAK